MKIRSTAWLGLALMFFNVPSAEAAPTAREVMVKNEEAQRIKEITSAATITTSGDGESKVKNFTWWRKLGADSTHFRIFARFHAPAEIRGEGILIEERDKNENEVTLYLPTFKKTRRVEGQSQRSSFMGSVFSYSDIGQSHANDFTQALLRTEPCPSEPRVQCTVVSSTPASESVRERTGYAKTVSWVRTDNLMVSQAEHFDLAGQIWKRLVATNISEVDPVAHRWFAHKIRIDDLKTKRFSILEFSQLRVDSVIADSTFTLQNLARE